MTGQNECLVSPARLDIDCADIADDEVTDEGTVMAVTSRMGLAFALDHLFADFTIASIAQQRINALG